MNNFLKSDLISSTLENIKHSIKTNEFIDVERTNVELKDLSTGNSWESLKETVCAFLNTDGGIVICGIRERDNKYILTGFDRKNESKIIELQIKDFKSDSGGELDLSDKIFFDYLPFNDKELLIIAVYSLSDDLKYVSYKGKYYERKLTQDREIQKVKLTRHAEYKSELEYSKEISIIDSANISDLSLDKINYYINLINLEIRSETLKPSIAKAKPFLANQHFIKGDNVTLLGLLVCGADPYHFLSSRVEVNAYYDTSSDIGRDKKIFRNDVISLMEETFRYIWGNIKINRTIREGGKSEPEYPEKLLRETINNALAHRDYSIDNFITVTVEPNQYIEIKNPGNFKEKIKVTYTESEIPIRRLIPGIPESKNPKLASVLKVYDKIESQGRGMASLVNAALDNKVDLAHYLLNDGMISLRIPTGRLVDESIENWLNGFKRYIELKIKNSLTEEHRSVLAYFYKSELLNKKRFYTILLSESNNHFDVIDEFRNAKILIEHEASTEETPIYILDRVLVKTDFREELSIILGSNEFINYDSIAKEILNVLFLYSKFNNQALKAADITPEVYRRIFGKVIIAKKYETLGRKVRNLCNQFVKSEILIKDSKSAYSFNFDFKKVNGLFG